jgi:hybrid cluster-associated redox disulfide protein
LRKNNDDTVRSDHSFVLCRSVPLKTCPTHVADLRVDEMMRTWPATVSVAIRRQMLCVGCPIGIFHTVADACRAHHLDQYAVVAELERAILETA